MVRVGIVGYGFMGKMHAQCYQAIENAEVVAVADAEPVRKDEAMAKLGCIGCESLHDMLASVHVDAVDICMPTYLHEEHAVAAARAGKHIICEKPLALTLDSCDRMIEEADRRDVKMMVAHVIRFWPEYQTMKDIVDSGKYGKPRWLSARRLSPMPTWSWNNWLADPEKSGGVILDLLIHDLDYIAYVAGSPGKVQAQCVEGSVPGLDSVLAMGWQHESGAVSYAEGSLALPTGAPFEMSLLIACERATIRYSSNSVPSLMVYPEEGEPFDPKLTGPSLGSSQDAGGNIASLGGYYNEMKCFVNCVQKDEYPKSVTPEIAREAVRICLAVKESARTNAVVAL